MARKPEPHTKPQEEPDYIEALRADGSWAKLYIKEGAHHPLSPTPKPEPSIKRRSW